MNQVSSMWTAAESVCLIGQQRLETKCQTCHGCKKKQTKKGVKKQIKSSIFLSAFVLLDAI